MEDVWINGSRRGGGGVGMRGFNRILEVSIKFDPFDPQEETRSMTEAAVVVRQSKSS